ncbi:MAG TPA: glycosyltransferase family 4 protein [Pyrinomonadaceae bacterium]
MIPPTGGAHTFLVELCDSLVRLGHRVSVVTQPGPEQSLTRALTDSGTEVLTTVWRAWHLPDERGRALAAWVNSERPDVYVISVSPDAGWVALPLLDSSIATVSIAHNDVSAFYTPLQHYGPFVDCAVGVSKILRDKIIGVCSIPADRARYIPYGVTSLSPSQIEGLAQHSSAPDQTLRIGYAGRLVQAQKRIMEFVPLAEQLVKYKLDFELHFIGEGSERSDLEAAFKRAGLEQHVRMWGWLSPDQMRQQLLQLDVFVLLSDYEGLPVALLEAMGHGLVPIVTQIDSGNTQLVGNTENGFVVPVGDIQGCATALQTLAKDRNMLLQLKRAAWESVQEYSVQRSTDDYVDCFAELVRASKRREHRKNLPEPFPIMPSCHSKYPHWLRKTKARLLSFRPAFVWK